MTAKKDASKLSSSLIATKGQAAPISAEPKDLTAGKKSPPQKASPSRLKKVPSKAVAAKKKTVAAADRIPITVKLDPEQFERMKIFGIRQRRTTQDIMVEALEALLKKASSK